VGRYKSRKDDTEIEPKGLTAMGQSPEDAEYTPRNTTTEEGEILSQLFEYTLPGWSATDNVEHQIQDEAGLGGLILL
jgi:hypothetical protein